MRTRDRRDGPTWDFTDQVVLVTGAAHGLGREHATRLTHVGARVVLTDIDGARVREVAEELGDLAWGVALDVRDEQAVESAVTRVVDRWGGLDAVVNNAGSTAPHSGSEAARFREVVNLNLIGTAVVCLAARPHLVRRGGGRIVNTASNTVLRHTGDVAPAYVAAKAGVVGLTHSLALELGAQGVRVNAVAPGLVDHEDFSRKMDRERIEAMVRVASAGQCLPRPGRPADVTEAVLFLLSGSSDWISGQVLVVDGGWSFA